MRHLRGCGLFLTSVCVRLGSGVVAVGESGWHKAPLRVRQPSPVSLHRSAATPCGSYDKPGLTGGLIGWVTRSHTSLRSTARMSGAPGRTAIRSSMNGAAAVTLAIVAGTAAGSNQRKTWRSTVDIQRPVSWPGVQKQARLASNFVFVNESWGILLFRVHCGLSV